MKTRIIFDTFLQENVPHELSVDRNGDIIAQSTQSEHFIKFPAGISKDDFLALLQAHAEANIGQVSAEEANAIMEASNDLIDELAD